MIVTKAIRLRTLVVQDPVSGEGVELTVYKDPVSESIFAIDSSFIEQMSVFIPSIYNSGTLQLDEDEISEHEESSHCLPSSSWPGGDESAQPNEYGVTITVDVAASSFDEAKREFLAAVARGAAEAAVFHIEHLQSGTVRELD